VFEADVEEENESEEDTNVEDLPTVLDKIKGYLDSAITEVDFDFITDEISFVDNRLQETEDGELKTTYLEALYALKSAVVEKRDSMQTALKEKEPKVLDNESYSKKLKALIEMLIDIDETMNNDGDVDGLQSELDYAKTELLQIEHTEATLQVDSIIVILQTRLDDHVAVTQQFEEGDVEKKDQDTDVEDMAFAQQQDVPVEDKKDDANAKLLSKFSLLAFPEASIEQVKDLLQNEGDAYEFNAGEKKKLMKDEEVFRQ